MPTNTQLLDQEVEKMKERGVAMPRSRFQARRDVLRMHQMANTPGDLNKTLKVVSTQNAQTLSEMEENKRLIREFGTQRAISHRQRIGSGSAAGGDTYAAIPRFYDPMEYWDLSGLPWNMADEGHRHKLHKWLRLFYATHYLVPILIDIFTRFPLVGMELECKDKDLTKFYEDLFFDQLNYPEFLVQLGREYWCVGEAFPLGSFDEDLGVWEREELLNPENIVIENYPLLGSKELKIHPPEYLRKLAQTKSPPKEYKMLEINFPEIIPYLLKNEDLPVSSVLLKQIANTVTSWDDHGTPILLRGLRTLMHEEKLMASQDAIAERLYSPLILAKLGILDLGDNQGPWFPGEDELEAFRDDLDIALSSDFRVLVHHMGLEMESVFGREQMPRLGDDFDRIERRIMQIFGVNPSLLSAGSNSQPYASSALQAEFLNQILRTFQSYLKRHFTARALVVAEAQGHYDYEKRGDQRYDVWEEVVEYDDDGKKEIKEKRKLLVPEMKFQTLDLRDEATERQFLQSLRAMGVPIPDDKLMVGIDGDFKDLVDEYDEELVQKTIRQQEAKMKTYNILQTRNLPIPPDLKAEVDTVLNPNAAAQPGGGGMGGMGGGPGGPGGPPGGPGGGPGGERIVMPPAPPGIGPPGGVPGLGPGGVGGPVPGGGPPPAGPMPPGGPGNAPPISFERRPGAPTIAKTEDSIHESSKDDNVPESDNDKKEENGLSDVDHENRRVTQRLPKNKKYTIIEPLEDEVDGTTESESPGSTQEDNRELPEQESNGS